MLLVGCGLVVKVAQFALLPSMWTVALHGSFCLLLFVQNASVSAAPCVGNRHPKL